jgi:hypothetical protein
MKTTAGILAGLLLAATVALGQQYQPKPFPQEANTALVASTDHASLAATNAGLPSSMAANQGSTAAVDTGSPFPSAANPSLNSRADAIGSDAANGGSPFPSAANPSK